jgi:hypothetical protein
MVGSHVVLPWKLPASLLILAAGFAYLGAASTPNHLLSVREKTLILAADGGQQCYFINSYVCAALNGTGGVTVTACGQSTYPNCSGDCTNACSGGISSYSCWEDDTHGPYTQCPNFQIQQPPTSCGFRTAGANCTGGIPVGGTGYVCYCTNGTLTRTSCGNASAKPNRFPPACQ